MAGAAAVSGRDVYDGGLCGDLLATIDDGATPWQQRILGIEEGNESRAYRPVCRWWQAVVCQRTAWCYGGVWTFVASDDGAALDRGAGA